MMPCSIIVRLPSLGLLMHPVSHLLQKLWAVLAQDSEENLGTVICHHIPGQKMVARTDRLWHPPSWSQKEAYPKIIDPVDNCRSILRVERRRHEGVRVLAEVDRRSHLQLNLLNFLEAMKRIVEMRKADELAPAVELAGPEVEVECVLPKVNLDDFAAGLLVELRESGRHQNCKWPLVVLDGFVAYKSVAVHHFPYPGREVREANPRLEEELVEAIWSVCWLLLTWPWVPDDAC